MFSAKKKEFHLQLSSNLRARESIKQMLQKNSKRWYAFIKLTQFFKTDMPFIIL
jgi:hypothetical protein